MVSNNRIEKQIRGIVREELNPIREELKSRPTRDEVKELVRNEFKPYPTREEVKEMIRDGVDIIRVLIEGYRNDFKAAVDGYKGLDGRVGSLEHRVDTLEKQV